jgi:hypothetical protein
MHAFLLGRLGNLLRRQPDAVVDHLEADISGLDGNLFCAIRMPVQPRFADQQFQGTAKRAARAGDSRPEIGDLILLAKYGAAIDGDIDTCRWPELAENRAQRITPFAGGDSRQMHSESNWA